MHCVVAGKAKHPSCVLIAETEVAVASVQTYGLQAPEEYMHF